MGCGGSSLANAENAAAPAPGFNGPSVMKAVNDIATGEMKAVAITQPGVTPAFRPTKDAAECTAVVEKDIAGKLEEPAGKAADTAVTVVGGATNQALAVGIQLAEAAGDAAQGVKHVVADAANAVASPATTIIPPVPTGTYDLPLEAPTNGLSTIAEDAAPAAPTGAATSDPVSSPSPRPLSATGAEASTSAVQAHADVDSATVIKQLETSAAAEDAAEDASEQEPAPTVEAAAAAAAIEVAELHVIDAEPGVPATAEHVEHAEGVADAVHVQEGAAAAEVAVAAAADAHETATAPAAAEGEKQAEGEIQPGTQACAGEIEVAHAAPYASVDASGVEVAAATATTAGAEVQALSAPVHGSADEAAEVEVPVTEVEATPAEEPTAAVAVYFATAVTDEVVAEEAAAEQEACNAADEPAADEPAADEPAADASAA